MNERAGVDPELESLLESVMKTAVVAHNSTVVEFDAALWSTLSDAGLTRLTATDEASWVEAAALLRTAARHGAAVPIAENDLLAGWLLARAGLPDDQSVIRTPALIDHAGVARRVPWASVAERILVIGGGERPFIADLTLDRVRIQPGRDLAGKPCDTVTVELDERDHQDLALADLRAFRLRGALARAVQMTGAMESVMAHTLRYARERVQFGRPIAHFQAIQHLSADLAGEVALSRAAVDAAVHELVSEAGSDLDRVELRVAVARSVVGHAADVVVRNAHQIHGAIGTTLEHRLHVFTNSLLAWRAEFGSVRYWDDRLTGLVLRSDEGPWALAVPTP